MSIPCTQFFIRALYCPWMMRVNSESIKFISIELFFQRTTEAICDVIDRQKGEIYAGQLKLFL